MWFPQLLLAIIAACAAWIAFQQWVTARLKLNHDLFERRFAVYVATQEHIVFCLNSIGAHADMRNDHAGAIVKAPAQQQGQRQRERGPTLTM
jgi:hypothetical protein